MNNVANASATLTDEIAYYQFGTGGVAQGTESKQKLLGATNAGKTGTPVKSGTFAAITKGSSADDWEAYVNTGTAEEPVLVEDSTSVSDASAYLIVTYHLTINAAANQNMGNYVITIVKGNNYADVAGLVCTAEGIAKNASAGDGTFAEMIWTGEGVNTARSVAVAPASAKDDVFTFRVIMWVDGTQLTGNIPAQGLNGKEILKATLTFVAA